MTKLFVGNLSNALTEDEVRGMLEKYMNFERCNLVKKDYKTFAFAEFADAASAEACMRRLDQTRYMGRTLNVNFATSKHRDRDVTTYGHDRDYYGLRDGTVDVSRSAGNDRDGHTYSRDRSTHTTSNRDRDYYGRREMGDRSIRDSSKVNHEYGQEQEELERKYKTILQELQRTGQFDEWKNTIAEEFRHSDHWFHNLDVLKDEAKKTEVFERAVSSEFAPGSKVLSNSLFHAFIDRNNSVIEDDVEDVIHDIGISSTVQKQVAGIVNRILGVKEPEEKPKSIDKHANSEDKAKEIPSVTGRDELKKELMGKLKGAKDTHSLDKIFESSLEQYKDVGTKLLHDMMVEIHSDLLALKKTSNELVKNEEKVTDVEMTDVTNTVVREEIDAKKMDVVPTVENQEVKEVEVPVEPKKSKQNDIAAFKQLLITEILEKNLFDNVDGIVKLFEDAVKAHCHLDKSLLDNALSELKEELELDWTPQSIVEVKPETVPVKDTHTNVEEVKGVEDEKNEIKEAKNDIKSENRSIKDTRCVEGEGEVKNVRKSARRARMDVKKEKNDESNDGGEGKNVKEEKNVPKRARRMRNVKEALKEEKVVEDEKNIVEVRDTPSGSKDKNDDEEPVKPARRGRSRKSVASSQKAVKRSRNDSNSETTSTAKRLKTECF